MAKMVSRSEPRSVGNASESRRSLCHSFSFAPLGLALVPLPTHGLRRGLHSYAASRLNTALVVHFSDDYPAMTQTPTGLGSIGGSLPRTYVPSASSGQALGYHMPPLRGWRLLS